jgi:hypothetical protein
MADTNWSVTYSDVRSAAANRQVAGLAAAMNEEPVTDWSFEVRGEPVADIVEFHRLLDKAEPIAPGEFVARANGVVIASA